MNSMEVKRAYALLPAFRSAAMAKVSGAAQRLGEQTPEVQAMIRILAHLWRCEERGVCQRLAGGPATGPDSSAVDTLETLNRVWQNTSETAQKWVGTRTDADLALVMQDPYMPSLTYSLERRLWHAVTHELYHLGQVNLLLRRCGFDPPEFDILEGIVHP